MNSRGGGNSLNCCLKGFPTHNWSPEKIFSDYVYKKNKLLRYSVAALIEIAGEKASQVKGLQLFGNFIFEYKINSAKNSIFWAATLFWSPNQAMVGPRNSEVKTTEKKSKINSFEKKISPLCQYLKNVHNLIKSFHKPSKKMVLILLFVLHFILNKLFKFQYQD